MDELKKYCLNDVRLTKELYDLYMKQHYLMVPSKQTGENGQSGIRKNDRIVPETLWFWVA